MGTATTSPSTMATSGQEGAPTSIALSAALSPAEFAAACTDIVTRHAGDAAHRELDALVTSLLSSIGYSEGMAIFMTHAAPFHKEPGE